ncbi:MAG: 16S rRNA (guanine(527)-N(7))-methyltransferase RsmG, partial [Mesorhizobium sp.]
MSADAWADLQKAAGPVSRETFERLRAFEQLFLKWNRSINLAAPSTLDDVWRRHILDSAQLARIAPAATRWV